jgi:hypothetical protein
MPIQLDTDFVSWRANQTLVAQTSNALAGISPYKITLEPNGTSVAGTVTITAPSDSSTLYPPMAVAAGATTGMPLYYDNLTQPINWRDFSITGLTATSTRIFIWYR